MSPSRRRVLRQAAKIALAAMLATAVAKLFHLPNPWFATLASIVAVEISMRASVGIARNAVIGAAIGAVAGWGLAEVAKDQIWAVGLVVLCAFAISGWLKLEAIGKQVAIVASVIVLVPETRLISTEYFAWVRFTETVIGITAALLVNRFVFRPRAYLAARMHLGCAYEELATLYRLVLAAEATGVRDTKAIIAARRSFRGHMRTVDQFWAEAISERPTAEMLAPHWRSTTLRLWEQCAAMDDAMTEDSVRGRLTDAGIEITELAFHTAAVFDQVGKALKDFEPLPTAEELLPLRKALLQRISPGEVTAWPLSLASALQVFSFINGLVVIATRLSELSVINTPDILAEVLFDSEEGDENGIGKPEE